MKTPRELLDDAQSMLALPGTLTPSGTSDVLRTICAALEQLIPPELPFKCPRDLDEDNPCFQEGIVCGRALERERIAQHLELRGHEIAAQLVRESES